jgi:two-component system, LytTR family, sensor kinase
MRYLVVPNRFRWLRFFWVPSICLFFSALSYGLCLTDEYGRQFLAIMDNKFTIDILLTALYGVICSEASLLIFTRLQEHFPIESRLTPLIIVHVLCSSLVWLTMFLLIQWLLYGFDTPGKLFLMKQNVPMSLMIALGLNAMYIGMTLLTRWQESMLEAEAFKRSHVEAQNASLKQHLDPHFLFNSLNTLTVLIEEEPLKAVHFVQELSNIYRYVLQSKEQTTVELSSELEYLQAIRFGEHFHVRIDVGFLAKQLHVPPLVVQLCIENAVKHNVVSHQMPLHCSVVAEDCYIVVTNNRQAKRAVHPWAHDSIQHPMQHPMQLGLASIRSRYALLTSTPVVIIETEDEFIVKLPLLPENIQPLWTLKYDVPIAAVPRDNSEVQS